MSQSPSPRRRQVALSISGLHCRGCASTVAGALRRHAGVLEADVDWGDGHGRVVYDADSTSPEAFLATRVFQPPSPFEATVVEDREV